jgi:hypothetical protein
MSVITPVAVSAAGAAVPKSAASGGGDSVHNALGATLLVHNGDSSSHNVILTGVVPCNQGGLHNETYAVAAGAEQEIPIPAHCVDPATGFCAVTYSAVTSVTVAATA